MQALDVLAEEYEIFEETMKKVTHETEEGGMLCAEAYEAMEELDKAQKDYDAKISVGKPTKSCLVNSS